MSLKENILDDHGNVVVRDKVAVAIDRLRAFEPPEGYYLAFSGGKDSQCIYHLAVEAGVKFDAHYNVTGIDPPPLVKFIKEQYPDVIRDMYKDSMWKLIVKRMTPPTRLIRYCCQELKEHGGEGRICVTGVRNAESQARSKRRPFEIVTINAKEKMLFNDNDKGRQLFENCMQKGKRVVNPIIDWEDADVWEFIHSRKLKYCDLYDKGWKRIGCLGCPMGNKNRVERDFKEFPKFKDMYIRAFQRMLEAHPGKFEWKTGDDVFNWWINGNPVEVDSNQREIGEDNE